MFLSLHRPLCHEFKWAHKLRDMVLSYRQSEYKKWYKKNIIIMGLLDRAKELSKKGVCKMYWDLSDWNLSDKDIDKWETFCLYEGFRGTWKDSVKTNRDYDGITLEW